MQLDLGGILASVLNDLLPGAVPVAGTGKPMADEGFQQLLSHLAAVVGEQNGGRFPLDAVSRPPQSGDAAVPAPVSLEALDPSWVDELRALAARVKIQVQPPDRSMPDADAELADLMSAIGPLLQNVFRELEDGGTNGGEGGAIAAPDGDGEAAARPALPLVELMSALSEKVFVPSEEEGEAPAVPVVPSSNEETTPESRRVEAAMSKLEAVSSAAERAAVVEPEVSVSEKLSAAERGPMEKPETPVPEKPSGPEAVPSARPDDVFRPDAMKNPALTPAVLPSRSVPAATVALPIDHPQWPDALGERLVWLRDNDIQAAELQIHPRHLGPVAVRIRVQDDQTTIQFASPHAVVREALEAALPRLRESFAGQQLPPVQVEVGQQFSGDQPGSQENRAGGHPSDRYRLQGDSAGDASVVPEDEGPRRSPATGNRLLSLYV